MRGNTCLEQGLISINNISTDKSLDFAQKLQRILLEVVRSMQAGSGSIVLMKGRKKLEVVASTSAELIGTKQGIEAQSPSAWVVKNRAPLYVDDISRSELFQKRFDHHEGQAFLLAPILSNGKVIGILSITDKIGGDMFSEREREALLSLAGQIISALDSQRLTESLKKKKRTLQQKNVELKRLEELKTDLFNMLIHDLKGPISELTANLDILSYTASDENQEYVEAARSGCDTLYSMVSNLLDIARLEEGRLDLFYERIDPDELVKEGLARLFGLLKMKQLTVKENFAPTNGRDSFWADRGILLRVLQNLLTNAINYSPAGETIEVGFEYLKPDDIEFFVRDNGPGVPRKHQEAIFDKYCQLEKQNDGRIYTVGLGLTFCKMAVEAHKGRIRVESEGSRGSRFSLILPLNGKRRR